MGLKLGNLSTFIFYSSRQWLNSKVVPVFSFALVSSRIDSTSNRFAGVMCSRQGTTCATWAAISHLACSQSEGKPGAILKCAALGESYMVFNYCRGFPF